MIAFIIAGSALAIVLSLAGLGVYLKGIMIALRGIELAALHSGVNR